MATLKVTAPFTVQLDPVLPPDPNAPSPSKAAKNGRKPEDPTVYVFPSAGTYEDVPDEVATHWYTLPHLEGYVPPSPAEAAGVVVLTPVPDEPPTEAEAQAILTPEQRAAIQQRRVAEAAAKAAEAKAKEGAKTASPPHAGAHATHPTPAAKP